MQLKQKPIIYTCIVKNYSKISQPPNNLLKNYEFICFAENKNNLNGWKFKYFKTKEDESPRRLAKKPKKIY